jgi:hypothetical protein
MYVQRILHSGSNCITDTACIVCVQVEAEEAAAEEEEPERQLEEPLMAS